MYHLATLHLVQIDDERRPINYASGCLVQYQNAVFLLSVFHATGNGGNWTIQLGFDTSRKQAVLQPVGSMGYVELLRIKRNKVKIEEIDFSYKLLSTPIYPRHQVVSPTGEIQHDEPKAILDSDLSCEPEREEEYGFYGLTKHSYNSHDLVMDEKLETGMKFQEIRDKLLFFKTRAPYKSYKEYRYCSGAPIFDSKGRLVSLVVEGDKKKTGILGLHLSSLRIILDVELMQIKGI